MANRIGVIGAGVMGEALIAALISSGNTEITFAEKRDERAAELESKYPIQRRELADVAASSDVILLVIKPQDMTATLAELAVVINPAALVISFAAGKTIASIEQGLNRNNAVVRVMPNTPALIGQGAAGYSFNSPLKAEHLEFVRTFLAATGKAVEVPETLQDAVTATSGSGPAYFFAFVEAMIDGAVALGLSHSDAHTLTVQTIVGAAALLESSGDSPTTLREKVTSPNGTTAAALSTFSDGKLNQLVATAMKSAAKRSQELSQ